MTSALHDPATWARIVPYLDRALELDADERENWLANLTAEQPEIAESLRQILQKHQTLNDRGFLADFALGAMGQEAIEAWRKRSGPYDPVPNANASKQIVQSNGAPGMIVGAYRLIREIGQGGMSSVWLAERCDGQLKREVALKLPYLGPQRLRLAERFERERDILATLTHPNIARLYDAGIGESGQPYLAIEYVHGAALTQYCDTVKLSIRDRLKIFLQVLNAVEFAHEQLVLHRDLKPSNILVTEQGRVVLLDFGIAKLLSEEFTQDRPLLTEVIGRILTPDYASPEHIAGRSLSTTTDVYSLGVVLYELLAGSRPFGPQCKSRRELEEAILTQDPLRPSQVAFTAEAASVRSTTARKFAQTLEGDLDIIVLKALKKIPGERYRSIDAFAQDITNHLENLPVSARPDSSWYRTKRFVARHTLPVSAAAIVLFAIIAGSAISLSQARAAAAERDRAVALASRNLALASRNEAVNEFLEMLITEAAASGKPVTMSEMLARSEKFALANTRDSAENRAAILSVIAGRYLTLGDIGKATQLFEHALALVSNSTDNGLRTQLICQQASALVNLGRGDEAVRAIARELDDPKIDSENASGCLLYRSQIARLVGDPEGSLRYATMALDRYRQAARITPVNEAVLLGGVASGHRLNGHIGEANRYFELALKKYTEAGHERGPNANTTRNNWALVSIDAGIPKRALELLDQNLSIVMERDPEAHPSAALVYNRTLVLELIGRYEEARIGYESASQIADQQRSAPFKANSLLGLASIENEHGNRELAAKYMALAQELIRTLSANSPQAMRLAIVRGQMDLADGKLSEAREDFAEAFAKKSYKPLTIEAGLGKAEAELLSGDVAAAAIDAQAALELATSLQGDMPYSNRTGLSWLMLGRLLQKQGNQAEAHKAFATAITHLANTVDENHPALVQARRFAAGT